MLIFLAVNGIDLEYTQAELSSIFIDLASGKITEHPPCNSGGWDLLYDLNEGMYHPFTAYYVAFHRQD